MLQNKGQDVVIKFFNVISNILQIILIKTFYELN